MFFGVELWAALGFALAAYAVVGNDALQTLGTFINSNRGVHWTILFLFAAAILVLTFTFGWVMNDGDPSYGRLANEAKYPVIDIQWYHALPPAVLLLITRLGIPVSTSFMVLTIFATLGGLTSMIEKSLIGYGLAFFVGAGIYVLITPTIERWFERSSLDSFVPRGLIAIVGTLYLTISQFLLALQASDGAPAAEILIGLFTDNTVLVSLIGLVLVIEVLANILAGRNKALYWVTMQWVSTGYLWSVWLIQDFANIFVFLPRELTAVQGFTAMMVIIVLLAVTFANAGGPVQRILRTKSNVTDIRSASIIDFIYATLLFFFKELSDIPMSTTWVFLGLIAGREYGFALVHSATNFVEALVDTGEDVAKAFIGIVISVDLALGLPWIAASFAGQQYAFDQLLSPAGLYSVIAANGLLIPIIWFAFSKPEEHPEYRGKRIAASVVMLIAVGVSGFLTVTQLAAMLG
ncbi:hypothetical protein PB2503_04532 [Parvularcula bermudensis HTCC2503]|uniref:Uncharacterized protein n=1 Tax=Parvularcula bermudensis (strain ATCC BAA-594 / HTCC2503 / KCTC 12087) TaxID=314260 RepID=E0TF63_PARBH|nr:hypothetical protein [Parvularcula bermudensis]ADM08981.1 hypothetical protein PB2503_04532 [Parvularcula bermudensis HTCC2503]